MKTWKSTKRYCESRRARLFEVHTREDYETALRFCENMGSGLWLGGSDLEIEGNWVWNSNEEKVKLHEFWLNGKPSNDTNKNCLVMGMEGMRDVHCANKKKSFCIFD